MSLGNVNYSEYAHPPDRKQYRITVSLNIVHLINKCTPPTIDSGGANRSVDWLAQAQSKAGHRVYVASPEGHDTDYFQHVQLPLNIPIQEIVTKLPADVSIVHLHGGYEHVTQNSHALNLPFIQTSRNNANELSVDAKRNVVYLSIAHMQLHNGKHYVYNGIPIDKYRYNDDKQRYLLFLAKVKRSNKGVDTATRLARRLRYPLIVAGGYRIATPSTWLPLSRYVKAVGTVGGQRKLDLLADAQALLVPISWEEPFGLTIPEALASGTPVIATRHGAMPELIEDGKTGFLCDTIDDMETAVAHVASLASADCRNAAEERFSIQRVRQDYDTLYQKVLNGAEW
jgi:glycosyltransferase involved in cell wall biosynthesis